jgi:hypothetical protein
MKRTIRSVVLASFITAVLLSAGAQIRSPSKELKPAVFPPDLAISEADLQVTPSLLLAGGANFTAEVNIRNVGSGPTRENVRLSLTVIDPSGRKLIVRDPLYDRMAARSNRRALLALDSRLFMMGEYRLEVVLDNEHKIGEADEGNNVARRSFRVMGPDLSTTEDLIDLPHVEGGRDGRHHWFHFRVRIDNNGNGDARNVFFHAEVWDEHSEEVWEKDIVIDRIRASAYYFQDVSETVGWVSGPGYSLNIHIRPNCREPNDGDNRVRKFFPPGEPGARGLLMPSFRQVLAELPRFLTASGHGPFGPKWTWPRFGQNERPPFWDVRAPDGDRPVR